METSKVVTGRIAALRVSPQLADMHDVLFLIAKIEQLRSALRAAMDDIPGWYDLARECLAGETTNEHSESGK